MNPQKIHVFLWYDQQAEEAASFYTSLFHDSAILKVTRLPSPDGTTPGPVLTVAFRLAGTEYVALNGGPMYHFTEAISLAVHCDDQAEVDFLWDTLVKDGQPGRCGWLKDKYGLSWQIVPRFLIDTIEASDTAKTQRVMGAMMTMTKMNIQQLIEAANGPS